MAEAAVQEVNESTAAVPEVIDPNSAGEFTTFDELEVHHEAEIRDKQLEARSTDQHGTGAQEEAEPVKEVKDAREEQKEEADEGDTKEAAKEEVEEVSDEAPNSKKESAKEALKESLQKDAGKLKELAAKVGDETVNISAEAEFEVTVDGKPVTAKLQDLVNNFSGATHLRQEVTKLREEQKVFSQEREDLNSAVDTVYDTIVNKGDPMGGIEYLAELMGANPLQVVTQLREQVAPIIEERQNLTAEEIRIKDLEMQLQFEKRQSESANKARQSQEDSRAIEERTFAVIQESGMDQETFRECYTYLKESGQVPPEELTPELVAEYYTERSARDSLGGMIKEVNPDISVDEHERAVNEFRHLMLSEQYSDMTVEDFREIAVELYGNKAAKTLSRKLKKANPVNSMRTPPPPENEPLFFDDL